MIMMFLRIKNKLKKHYSIDYSVSQYSLSCIKYYLFLIFLKSLWVLKFCFDTFFFSWPVCYSSWAVFQNRCLSQNINSTSLRNYLHAMFLLIVDNFCQNWKKKPCQVLFYFLKISLLLMTTNSSCVDWQFQPARLSCIVLVKMASEIIINICSLILMWFLFNKFFD